MTPARAVLVRRRTDDGLVVMNDNIQLGTVYRVDIESMRLAAFFNNFHRKNHEKLIVDSLKPNGEVDGWLPVDLLRIES